MNTKCPACRMTRTFLRDDGMGTWYNCPMCGNVYETHQWQLKSEATKVKVRDSYLVRPSPWEKLSVGLRFLWIIPITLPAVFFVGLARSAYIASQEGIEEVPRKTRVVPKKEPASANVPTVAQQTTPAESPSPLELYASGELNRLNQPARAVAQVPALNVPSDPYEAWIYQLVHVDDDPKKLFDSTFREFLDGVERKAIADSHQEGFSLYMKIWNREGYVAFLEVYEKVIRKQCPRNEYSKWTPRAAHFLMILACHAEYQTMEDCVVEVVTTVYKMRYH